MARKSKRDWFITAIYLLAEGGPAAITIDALCQRLEVTKGSFYHHFKNYDDFKLSFLNYYEEAGTLNIIERLTERPSATEKIYGLLDIIVAETSGTAVPEAPYHLIYIGMEVIKLFGLFWLAHLQINAFAQRSTTS